MILGAVHKVKSYEKGRSTIFREKKGKWKYIHEDIVLNVVSHLSLINREVV